MTLFALMPQFAIDAARSVLLFFHNSAGLSWGLSIIALTVVVRTAILPLTFKQVRGMQEMQRHAPELKKLQERFKEDPQRRNEETMKYYKEHSFNPLSACLPLALQIPVFITLFDLLRAPRFRSDIAGQESFLFIKNLADPAHGWVLYVLMALYVGTQLGASLVSMVSAEKTQKRIMLALPFVFVPVIISFQAGLIVYWITTNFWTVGQQLVVKRFMPSPAVTPATAKGTSKPDRRAGGGKAAREASAGKSNGGAPAGKATAKATAGAGVATGGGRNGGPAKAPPGSPRKKKKRSGRRR